MYLARCEDALASTSLRNMRGHVQLVFTSPPFVLNRKKKYGNLEGQAYVDWIASLADRFVDYLTPSGSIVIELGNAWEPGEPVMSTLALEALLAFKKRAGLHLCQEFVCFNPARLPSPAQWVNVDRCRVKDAFTRVWWLSPTTRPKADNKKILTAYSDSMQSLLKRGTYNSGLRPSEHRIGDQSFLANNGGAIPPNVLVPDAQSLLEDLNEALGVSNLLSIANTRADDPYQKYCREAGIQPHPARMPARLVQFFVEFLTDPGDLVLDPFGGSNTTGSVAEQMGRRWIAIDAEPIYVNASRARFSAVADETNLKKPPLSRGSHQAVS